MRDRSSAVRTSGAILVWCAVLLLSVRLGAPPVEAQRSGPRPWTGPVGVTESVATIMAREAGYAGQATAAPEHPALRADRGGLAQNPAATGVPVSPPAVGDRDGQGVPHLPQTPSTSFTGASLIDDGIALFPPDSMGAVGPTQFIVAINGRIRSFNKATGTVDAKLNASTAAFFASVANNAGTADPRIRYDRQSGRWFIIMITTTLNNRVMVAVSDAGVITSQSNFTFFFIEIATITPPIAASDPCLADYPTLGIDTNALYIGVNNFCGPTVSTALFHSTDGYVVRKSSVLGAGPLVATVFRGLVPTRTDDGLYTPQGVDNFDAGATEGYFIGVSAQFYGKLMLRRVSDPGGTPSISADIPINVNPTGAPVKVPHLGNTGGDNGRLDALDDRLYAAVLRNGRLWTAHNIQVNTAGVASDTGGRNGVRWYEIQNLSGTPAPTQQGTIFDPTALSPKSYWVGTVMVSGQGHMAAGFSQAGNNDRADAAAAGRLAGDAANTTRAVTPLTATIANYNPAGNPGGARGRRWGDYSYTSLDPEDDMTMWTIQEFTDRENSWGVRGVKLLAPPPVTPNAASPSNLATGSSAVSVTLTGPATNGAGFFEPGPGFSKHIGVTVSGGVTVNSVTVVNPTTLTLSLNTTAATNGAKNVTITNPDGQTVTATNAFTVGPTAVPGDVNGSGAMDITDALCVARAVAGLPASAACPAPLVNPDVNGSGAMDITDALCIARAVAGLPLTPSCPNPLGAPLAPPSEARRRPGAGPAVARDSAPLSSVRYA